MLSKRFQNDEKAHLSLNELQQGMKSQIEEKIAKGIYSFEKVPCCICGGSNFELFSEKDRYGLYHPVVICRDCGLIQTNPRMRSSFKQVRYILWEIQSKGDFLISFLCFIQDGQLFGGPIVEDEVVSKEVSTLDRYDFVKYCKSLIPKEAQYIAHRNGFDYEKLKAFLEIAGFTRIRRSFYKNSIDPEMRSVAFDR